MQQNKWLVAGVILAVVFSALSVAMQVKKAASPFERYIHNPANELAVREIAFDVRGLRLRIPYENGWLPPHVEGIAEDGRLIIQIDVTAKDLPQTVDERRAAMLNAVGICKDFYRDIFGNDIEFDKNTRVIFYDVDTILKSTIKKPLDPAIAIYEDKELTFH